MNFLRIFAKTTFGLITICAALVMGGCDSEPEENTGSNILRGTVTIGDAVLNQDVTANTDGIIGGLDSASSYNWEYAEGQSGILPAADDFSSIPGVDLLTSNNGKTISLTESDYIKEGNFIRVTVTRAGRDGEVTSDPGEIYAIDIISVTLRMQDAGGNPVLSGSTVVPNTEYRLFADVEHSDSVNNPSLFQAVTWEIAELLVRDELHDRYVDITSQYITTNGILNFNADAHIVNTLTITATSEIDKNKTSDLSIDLDVHWDWDALGFRQLTPLEISTREGEGPHGFYSNDYKVGLTVMPDNTTSYFIDQGKSDWWYTTDRDLASILYFDGFKDFDGDLSGYTRMTVDAAFENAAMARNTFQLGTYLYIERDIYLEEPLNDPYLMWFWGNLPLAPTPRAREFVTSTAFYHNTIPFTSGEPFNSLFIFFCSYIGDRDNNSTYYLRKLRVYKD